MTVEKLALLVTALACIQMIANGVTAFIVISAARSDKSKEGRKA